MLVRKNELNEIDKKGTFTQGFNHCRKIKRKVSQKLQVVNSSDERKQVSENALRGEPNSSTGAISSF